MDSLPPTARVNITLDVETNGARVNKELPLKLLCLGNYSNGKDKRSLAKRELMPITKLNFQQVLARVNPRLSLSVENQLAAELTSLSVDLSFAHIEDFGPENVAHQVPALRELIAMRNVLSDLKACLANNKPLKKQLAKALADHSDQLQLSRELKQHTPLMLEVDHEQ